MNKSFKAAAFIAVTALVLAMPVAAQQGGEPQELQSNTSKATAGVFESNVDYSMDVHDYSNVVFTNWTGFIGYGGDPVHNPVTMGFSTRFRIGRGLQAERIGNIYLGTWYTGNIFKVRENWNETVTVDYDLQNQLQTSKETTKIYNGANNTISSNNQIEALLGIANMGFKLGFWENVTETKYPGRTITVVDNNDGTLTHSEGDIVEYSSVEGKMAPSLVWGMKIPLGENGLTIRPMASVNVNIAMDNKVDNYKIDGTSITSFNTAGGRHIGPETIFYNGTNAGYVTPDFMVGAYVDLPGDEDQFIKIVDFSYGLGFDVYDNSYDVSGFKGKVKGTIDWESNVETTVSTAETSTIADIALNIDEATGFYHKINMGYFMEKEIFDHFTFGLYTGLGIEIDVKTSDAYTKGFSTSRIENNSPALSSLNTSTEIERRGPVTTTKETDFRLKPFVNVGGVYEMTDHLSINAGLSILPFAYTSSVKRTSVNSTNTLTITKIFNGSGDVTSEDVTLTDENADSASDSVQVDNTWEYFRAGIWGGFVFTFDGRASLDMCIGGITDIGATDFELNVTNVSVLFTFKF